MKKLFAHITYLLFIILTGCATHGNLPTGAPKASPPHEKITVTLLDNPEFLNNQPGYIWYYLQQVPKNQAQSYSSSNPISAGWLNLYFISKQFNADNKSLTAALIAWRQKYPNHPANNLFPSNEQLTATVYETYPRHIALLLPLHGPYAALGNSVRSGFLNAYYASLAKYNMQQNLSFYDTSKKINIEKLYKQAVDKGADFVIGPLTKDEVNQLLRNSNFKVPVLTLNYSQSWFSATPKNVYQFGLSPIDEVTQVADKAWQDQHTSALIITSNDEWSNVALKALKNRWQENGGKVADVFQYDKKTNFSQAIPKLLDVDPELIGANKDKDPKNKDALPIPRRNDFDVIFLLAKPVIARQIAPLLRFYFINHIPIYSPSIIYSGIPSPTKDNDLNGIHFCDIPVLINGSNNKNRFLAVGHDAYFISHSINRFQNLANFPWYGETGALILTTNNQFYRRLPWTQMHNGHP